jgi:hypothetical protein
MMNKKAIAILGAIFLLIVLALGTLIYLRSRKSNTNNQQNQPANNQQQVVVPDNTPTNTNTEPETPAEAKAQKLTDGDVISPALYFNGQGISYFNQQGQLFTTDLQVSGDQVLLSNKRELTIPLKPNINNIYWAPTGQNFIAEFQSNEKNIWSYYDGTKGAYVDLPNQVQSLDWLGTTGQILFVWQDETGKAYLNSGNPDTSGYKVLTDLYEPDNRIAVSPDGKSVLFYRFSNSGTQNSINFVSPDGKVFKTIVKDGYNYGVSWAPDGNKFLFNKRDPSSQKYGLWVGDLTSGEVKNLNVETILEKTSWSQNGQTVYAAVPTKGTIGQGLTEDALYKINVSTTQRQQYDLGVAADVRNIFPDQTETNIFFKNAQDQFLYYFNIKTATPQQ